MDDHRRSIIKNWKLLVEGEKQGLYTCFNLFYDDLYRFGLSLYRDPELIKESIQNLFIELWAIRDKLANVGNIQQYVFTIYKRIIYKTYQKSFSNDPDLKLPLEEVSEEMLSVKSYESILIASQEDEYLKKRLKYALAKLTPRQKEIILMRYFECLSFKDIAHKTLLTERTVYNTLHSAISALRENLLFIWPFF
ncbi:RNA polymerase sigma-70 factor, ECF subfamily [Pedobacter steynii]|uniref:RNA polymerase sigma-70 factor, ECF subfamily n=1 Tax=Pedobacter steynii TaxID=430522 RepID=A0A1H0EHT1_9SPHI|nr:sigma-70 family RNA polymerase sigma factor [Pedobacter steynii]NQX42019.1 sigma-70 family RNA polymerase sigma factor [Pedobacter steynii]SDN81903.1 RNA polymerase sigma-70 factor, ECF subfamily [Pedobacter steynii]